MTTIAATGNFFVTIIATIHQIAHTTAMQEPANHRTSSAFFFTVRFTGVGRLGARGLFGFGGELLV